MDKPFSGRRRARPAWNIGVACGLLACGAASAQSNDTLTLAQALAAVRNHPSLEAISLESRARERAAGQAARWANPRLSLEAENFAGTGPLAGADALETTARLEQTVDMGGKRALRREQAGVERRLADQQGTARERELTRTVREAFLEGLWLQERQALLREDIGILKELTESARRRKEAGGGAVADEQKLRVQWAEARLDADRVAGELEVLRMRLRYMMGDSTVRVAVLQGDFARPAPLPSWETVARDIEQHPDLVSWGLERELRVLSSRAARAQNVPDLDVNAGVRRLNAGGGDWALVGGVSVPLPVWNRHRGDIKGAELRGQGAARDVEAARRELLSRAYTLWHGLRVKAAEIEQLRTEVLPGARQARDASRAAYAAGRFNALELMDGHKLWIDLNERHLAVLLAYHRETAELDALSGASQTINPGILQ